MDKVNDGGACHRCKGRGVVDDNVDADDCGGSIGTIEPCPVCVDTPAAAAWRAMGDENYLFGSGPFEDAHPDDQDAARRIAAAVIAAIPQQRPAAHPSRGVVDDDLHYDGASFERAYRTGYRAALGAAAAECRRLSDAVDHGGNHYSRPANALQCAGAILGLRVPSIEMTDAETHDAIDALAIVRKVAAFNGGYIADDLVKVEARLLQMATALSQYKREEWSPVTNYSDNHWYMTGEPWAAAESALQAAALPAVPSDWVMVPRVPTEPMVWEFCAERPATTYLTHTTLQCADFASRYAAMLAATPAHDQPEGEG